MKYTTLFISLLGFLYIHNVHSDVYMHSLRGSNNRLNEKSANRNNANRLFDSQNNNRGGYNVGDKTQNGFNQESGQFNMEFFQSGPKYRTLKENQGKSLLTIEWTNQHGCGGNEDSDPNKMNCNVVLQYMCENDQKGTMRNGKNTNTPNYNKQTFNNQGQKNTRKNADTNANNGRGMHESWENYDKCNKRERNKGLFAADQKLAGESSIYTRQNPNGNRRGYECPEERDYYPYWHPTDWKDIAVFAHEEEFCEKLYEKESFNVKPKGECLEYYGKTQVDARHASKYNRKDTCEANNGIWVEFNNFLEESTQTTKESCEGASTKDVPLIWAIPYNSQKIDILTGTDIEEFKKCLVVLPKPHCQLAPWSRDNHHGNGRDGVPLNYTWVLPYFPSKTTQRCVFRIRYNISTDDYDPYNTNSSQNNNLAGMVQSPIQQNELVDIGAVHTPLRLALNTAQYGRTFQDRSHIFKLVPRPDNVNDKETIRNLNVRGKRGNIVQVYPAVEYDFIPNLMSIGEDELVHIQWTGSNTHNNGNPGGDGQTGDAGEGTGGTDRNNIVQTLDPLDNFPVPYENSTLFKNAKVRWSSSGSTVDNGDLAVSMASSGYYECLTKCPTRPGTKAALNNQLNNAPASYRGMLLQFNKGKYHYICSRNNNFSNRSQKGFLNVIASKP